MATNFEKLRRLLEELFQLDQADLDFGIYRIMNQKRDEIVEFLDKKLLPQVQEAFSQYKSADKAEIQKELDTAIEQAKGLGVDPESTSKVKELREKYDDSAVDVAALENEVFSYLYSFFRRYYDEGDFLSQRRYKEGVYAIPYEGEEVKLHWANHDQYYIKSSEYLRDYTFKIASGKRVRVHLVSGSTEQDNKKPAEGKERRFQLCEKNPIIEQDGELFIRFEYRPDDGKQKQDALNAQSIKQVVEALGSDAFKATDWAKHLTALEPTEKNKDRTTFEKHLRQYTSRNTFDYFIHKDLGAFLQRELDFFIKSEVMHLDDIDDQQSSARVEQYLSKIKVIRRIAKKIIAFLEQLESFQKKLWLKKKFVIETNYCITLDRVPESLLDEIAINESQANEWVRLFAIDKLEQDLNCPGYSQPLTPEFLRHHHHLVLDTKFFGSDFKSRLLAGLEDLDEQFPGLLVSGDNFAALSLVQNALRDRVQAVCVDPPYNTGEDGFAYKDQYQHSSWISMMTDRFARCAPLLRQDAAVFTNIDDTEYRHLWHVLAGVFGTENYLGSFVWKRRSASAMSSHPLSLDHEYVLAFGKSAICTSLHGLKRSEANYPLIDEKSGRRYASDNLTVGMTSEQRPNQFYPITNPRTGKVFQPNPSRVWRFYPETMEKVIEDDLIIWPDEVEGNQQRPRYKTYFDPENMKAKPCSSWIETAGVNDREIEEEENDYLVEILQSGMNSEGSRVVDRLFGSKPFAYPKPLSLIRSLVRASTREKDTVLDFFAGSGTTGHAVIEMNREDGGDRRYVLVEVGDYFDSVLKPRMQKVVYSKDWREGVPRNRNGISHGFKYIRLESYEDALNNLKLKRTDQQATLLKDDDDLSEQYTLSYMLDVESRGSQSLLNVDDFRNPDEYKLKVEKDGETQLVNIDLVETFNWLLGLTVKHIDVIRGVRVVEGTNPEGDRVLILWRNLDETDNDALDKWFAKQDYNTKEQVYDIFYVNGDSNIENLRRPDQTWKVRLIEEEFQRLMFDVEDV
ncbi:site-specific DNA-methyltransferase [Novipirellula sp. SH528]|uniref:site-specific DNA-methyltransferase n=1 Tax=Novipirellula sp. SH528 TaxID=3454466 RepID=UPI003F9EF765